MSVTSLLDTDAEFRAIIREHLPKKEQFCTNRGDKAFSKSYELLAPNNLNNRFYSNLIGTAFDYVARFIVARYACVNHGEEDEMTSTATSDLNSLHGFSCIKRTVEKKDGETYQKLYDKYVNAIACVKIYFMKPDLDHTVLIGPCCFLARMEQVYRSGGIMPRNGYESLLEKEPEEEYNDLKRLCDVFYDTFIAGGIVHEGSQVVVFNPAFGKASNLAGGADADIYIDGVLYDFKTTKESRYHWEDVAQIYVYYLLYCMNAMTAESMSAEVSGDKRVHHMITGNIEKIALYKARFGAVESLDVSLIEGELGTIRKLIDYLGAKKKYSR